MSNWKEHPLVTTGKELTLGQRAADAVRNGMGSWVFVFIFSLGMAAWMSLKGGGADPFPFILLNLVLSTLAAIQGAILLIAAKRADQIASELALKTYRLVAEDHATDSEALTLVRELHEQLVTKERADGDPGSRPVGRRRVSKKAVAAVHEAPGGDAGPGGPDGGNPGEAGS